MTFSKQNPPITTRERGRLVKGVTKCTNNKKGAKGFLAAAWRWLNGMSMMNDCLHIDRTERVPADEGFVEVSRADVEQAEEDHLNESRKNDEDGFRTWR